MYKVIADGHVDSNVIDFMFNIDCNNINVR